MMASVSKADTSGLGWSISGGQSETDMPSFDRPTNPDIAPSPWVLRWINLIRGGGHVLDLAAGQGRHTRVLTAMGLRVTAVDIDVSALNGIGAEVIAADLECGTWPLPNHRFDGIVITNYLHRPHFPHLVAALNDGGVLIFETFGRGNERLGRPRNPDFLLAPGELLTAFGTALQIVAYEHGEERQPRPAVRQRICAVKQASSVLLA